MKRVVVDAENLHVGGGVQVASAFIQNLLEQQQSDDPAFPWVRDARVVASAEVLANLPAHVATGATVAGRSHGRAFETPDLRFVIFGPRYRRPAAKRTLAGFADVTTIYPSPLAQPVKQQLKGWLRRRVSHRYFRTADHLVVETRAVQERLVECGFDRSRITVVPNTYHPIFDQPVKPGTPSPTRQREDGFRLLYVARAYAHKNHDFLGEVAEEYQRLTGTTVDIRVTLTDAEWRQRSSKFRRTAVNLGAVPVDCLPDLYRDADAVIFPSLLECFSATPLEAMVAGRPLIASDRDFVRTLCGKAASYFDPRDPKAAAEAISRVARDRLYQEQLLAHAAAIVQRWPNNADRSHSYLELMDRMLRG